MNCQTKSPFDSIEAAHEYLTLLSMSVEDNKQRIQADIIAMTGQSPQRHLQVLSLVAYNLEKLEKNLKADRQTLNSLRKLRRLLLSQRSEKSRCPQEEDELSVEITSSVGG